jgi:hypothetical protein
VGQHEIRFQSRVNEASVRDTIGELKTQRRYGGHNDPPSDQVETSGVKIVVSSRTSSRREAAVIALSQKATIPHQPFFRRAVQGSSARCKMQDEGPSEKTS